MILGAQNSDLDLVTKYQAFTVILIELFSVSFWDFPCEKNVRGEGGGRVANETNLFGYRKLRTCGRSVVCLSQ